MTAARIKEQVDRQHADIWCTIMDNTHKDDQFRTRLLRELQLADEELRMEMSSRSRNLSDNKTATVYTLVNLTPTKNGMTRTRKESQPGPARTPDTVLLSNMYKFWNSEWQHQSVCADTWNLRSGT